MWDLKEYIEFNRGNIPLIISVPHGGTLNCAFIPKRLRGIFGIDKSTIEFAKDLVSKFALLNSKSPSYIISKIHRSKIDLNRNKNEAYNQNSLIAREVYTFYHYKIRDLILDNLRTFNYSLLIDIHGFEANNRPSGFRDVDIVLGTNNLESFFPYPIPRKDWDKNLRGDIIRKFIMLNIPIAPGHPKRKEYILTGGYITLQYGASKINNSQSMQIEFSDRIRVIDEDLRAIVLENLAKVLLENIMKNKVI
ncbi:MAG: hypothetical protein ACFFHD_10635 [Promethearchaeota archaeon]